MFEFYCCGFLCVFRSALLVFWDKRLWPNTLSINMRLYLGKHQDQGWDLLHSGEIKQAGTYDVGSEEKFDHTSQGDRYHTIKLYHTIF